jgi:hypothetical protein
MKGEGYYDLHSEYQRRIIAGGEGLIRMAADAIDLSRCGSAFTMADYGASTGGSSVQAVKTALRAIRRRDGDLPFHAIHNDVPSNDFTQLFANVAGKDGYLGEPGGPVYASAAAGSFFDQVLPSGTVDLGTCSNAAHWFREQRRQPIESGMFFSDASGESRQALADGAAGDWLRFLSARSEELAPGGTFLVQGIGTDESGNVSASRLLGAMWRAADALAGEGLLDRAALGDYVFPVYCRSIAEVAAPVAEGGPLAESLELVSATLDVVPDPYWEAFERDGDPAAYAQVYTQFVRAFSESTLAANLLASGEVCDRYFAALEAAIAGNPEAARYEAWVVRALFKRRR